MRCDANDSSCPSFQHFCAIQMTALRCVPASKSLVQLVRCERRYLGSLPLATPKLRVPLVGNKRPGWSCASALPTHESQVAMISRLYPFFALADGHQRGKPQKKTGSQEKTSKKKRRKKIASFLPIGGLFSRGRMPILFIRRSSRVS